MKNRFFLTLTILMMCFLHLNAQDFNAEYKMLDSLPNISRLVHNVATAPKWIDSLNFTCEIREKEGLKKYKIKVLNKSKELVTEELYSLKNPPATERRVIKAEPSKLISSPD